MPNSRPENSKYFHISGYMMHKDLIYIIPTILVDLNPLNGDIIHIRIHIFRLVLQLEFFGKTKKKGWLA